MALINKLSILLIISQIVFCTNNNRNANTARIVEEPSYTPTPLMLNLDIDTSISYIMGKFDPKKQPGFVEIDTIHADRSGLHLRNDTYKAFIEMFEQARQDGIRLVIRSATRNFDYQKGIWERKWTGETELEGGVLATAIADPVNRALTILKYSSMPGTSRHHWGTDIDLNSFNNAYFSSGEGLRLYSWLQENAYDYGFCQPYTKKGEGRNSGYEEEKWHWSYFPVSKILTAQAAKYLDESMIAGFLGSETAGDIKIVERFVLGVDANCYSF